ncbi:hypothetical protein J6590_034020 [Homalodisca vitripennis]|nr:hypothetical protein J6590_034020 [Homalodisca vitripennis]
MSDTIRYVQKSRQYQTIQDIQYKSSNHVRQCETYSTEERTMSDNAIRTEIPTMEDIQYRSTDNVRHSTETTSRPTHNARHTVQKYQQCQTQYENHVPAHTSVTGVCLALFNDRMDDCKPMKSERARRPRSCAPRQEVCPAKGRKEVENTRWKLEKRCQPKTNLPTRARSEIFAGNYNKVETNRPEEKNEGETGQASIRPAEANQPSPPHPQVKLYHSCRCALSLPAAYIYPFSAAVFYLLAALSYLSPLKDRGQLLGHSQSLITGAVGPCPRQLIQGFRHPPGRGTGPPGGGPPPCFLETESPQGRRPRQLATRGSRSSSSVLKSVAS